MINSIKSAVLILLLSLTVHGHGFAQERPGSEEENSIISAVAEMNAGRLAPARDILSALLAENTDNDAAWYYLAMVSLMENDLVEAEEYLKAAVKLDPENFWYRYRLANIYGMTQRQEMTVEMYEKMVEDFPKRSELYLDMVSTSSIVFRAFS